ncbi:MAG: transglycosylase SLT domain-containing protein [Elusimicrobia bacterium]|nr:transglycosylase SLT domain-containing protein [Elusimicrobiota bacterium]
MLPSLLAFSLSWPALPASGAVTAPIALPSAVDIIPADLLSGQFGTAWTDQLAVVPSAPASPEPANQAAAQRFEDEIAALVDELYVKDPALFNKIRAEGDRIRALPTRQARIAAVQAGYPVLERSLDRSAAAGKLSPQGAARWQALRAQAQQALAEGTLFERAQFAGQAFDEKVHALLEKGITILDPSRKLPEQKSQYLKLAQSIHDRLAVRNNSTNLTPAQLDRVFALVGQSFGIRAEFLKYMAKTESGLKQVVPSNPAAAGIMQIEKVHKQAHSGARNVANDTITNIVFGGLLRAQTDRAMAQRYLEAGLAPPRDARVVEFLGDLAYNRGPGLLKYVAANAAKQRIDIDKFAEYVGGRGGSYSILDGGLRLVVNPGPGTGIDKTGKNSVLELSSEAVGRVQFSKRLTEGLGDRNGDGRVDHLDVWLTRGIRYLGDPQLR